MRNLTGRLVQPSDPGWDDARKGFAVHADYDSNVPRGVLFCGSAADVETAVRWAKDNRVPIRARCGRHSYEAYSSLVKDGIVVDVSDMSSVSLSADRSTATVGAGIESLDLFEALGACGVSLPSATGKSVGVAGLTLGGGFGVTSRKWGLMCDQLVEVELVTPDGHLRRVSEKEHPDLSWALCGGGGGNFGIVTSFTFRVHPVKDVALFDISYPWQAFEAVVDRWQHWNHEADWGMTSYIALLATQEIHLQGQYTADDADLPKIQSILAPMLDPAISPIAINVQVLPALPAARVVVGVDPMNPLWRVNKHTDNQIFKSTSAFMYNPLPMPGIQLLKQQLEACPPLSAPPSQPSMIQLLGGGGAASQVDPAATAAFHRAAWFVVQYDAYWTAPENAQPTLDWIEGFRTQMEQFTTGAYVNYVDHYLVNPMQQYYGTNLARLVEVKKKYDPENMFNFPQSIPLSL